MNEIQIITDEKVCIESLSEAEQRLFYMSILTQILELHRQERLGWKMAYSETKVYFDESHYIAIPKTTHPHYDSTNGRKSHRPRYAVFLPLGYKGILAFDL